MNRIQTFAVVLVTLVAMTASLPGHADDNRGNGDDDRYGYRHGYGMGMMGGGYGMGMMGGPIHMLDLTDAQRKKINSISDASRKKNWEVMGKMMDKSASLRDLYAEDRFDVARITATYEQIFLLQKEMIRDRLTARNQQYDLLNDKQRKELKELRGGYGPGYGRGYHGRGMGMMGR